MKGLTPEREDQLRSLMREIMDDDLEAEGPEGLVQITGHESAIDRIIYKIKELP